MFSDFPFWVRSTVYLCIASTVVMIVVRSVDAVAWSWGVVFCYALLVLVMVLCFVVFLYLFFRT